MTTNTTIATSDNSGVIPAYVVQPSGDPRGTIIVVQEVFGVNPGIRQKADDWAALGYRAIAPDVFWRQQVGVDLDPDVPEQFQQAIALMMKHDFVQGLADMQAVLAWAQGQGGKVGLVGYCMGGKIAYEMACASNIDAAVAYYGVGIDNMLDRAEGITGQLMLHVPTNDGFVNAEAQAAMHSGLDANPHVTLHDYQGLDHGFADTFGKRRDVAGAKLADERTSAFFASYVG